jgi:hypothetical protein
LFGAHPDQFLLMGFLMACLGGMTWYFFKGIFITANTAANWHITNPGEPMFKCCDVLTEYHETMARRTGQAAGEAIARELRRHEREKQERLDNQ